MGFCKHNSRRMNIPQEGFIFMIIIIYGCLKNLLGECESETVASYMELFIIWSVLSFRLDLCPSYDQKN